MKRLISFIFISALFISVIAFNGQEAHAQVASTYSTTKNTLMRKSDNKCSLTLYTIKKGVKLQSNYRKGNWTQVRYQDKLGWIENKSLKKITVGKGTIKGKITWKLDDNNSTTMPDEYGNIMAFPIGGFKKVKPDYLEDIMDSDYSGNMYGIYHTNVDKKGRYSLDLPAGDYHLLIVSFNTVRNYRHEHKPVPNSVINILERYFKGYNANRSRLFYNNHLIKTITINKSETQTLNKDWGHTSIHHND